MSTATAHRQRYHTDLQALHAECETNYLRLGKLFPALAKEDCRHVSMQSTTGHERRFRFLVTERSRYTTTLEISECDLRMPWGMSASFVVRLYHDAGMAEVTAFQNQRNPGHFNTLPNPRMLHADERTQWNFLLGEWLVHCLTRGYNSSTVFHPSAQAVCAAGDDA